MATVLLVEDSPSQATVIRQHLVSGGHSVTVARSAEQALDLISEAKPAVVASDVVMPGMSGHELCRTLKDRPPHGLRGIVLFSEFADASEIIKALECGADHFIAKPIDPKTLIARVAEVAGWDPMTMARESEAEVTWGGRKVRSSPQRILNCLVASYEGILGHNVALKTAEASLRATNVRLEQQRQVAEQAVRMRTDFLATMSHELRTPLNAIVGMSGLLNATELPESAKEYASVIGRASESLVGIVSQVLDFSKIDAGQMEIHREAFDLRTCLEDATEFVAFRAQEKKLDLACHLDDKLAGAYVGDAVRIGQIVANLLSNAVKFTSQGEVVVAADAMGDGRVRIRVKDTGSGIAPQDLANVFKPYVQAGAHAGRGAGTGLGLPISSRLCELMGGSLVAMSQPGEGSIFEAHLPLQSLDAASVGPTTLGRDKAVVLSGLPRATDHTVTRALTASGFAVQSLPTLPDGGHTRVDLVIASTDCLEKAHDRLAGMTVVAVGGGACGPPAEKTTLRVSGSLSTPVRRSTLNSVVASALQFEKPAESLPTARIPRPSDVRVLVVDDDSVNRLVAKRMLERMGVAVEEAASATEAMAVVRDRPVNVVLMDVWLGEEMDGIAAARTLRQEWPNRNLRIIAVTANALPGDRERCLAAGMDDYLTKPVRFDRLRDALMEKSTTGQWKRGTAPVAIIDPSALERLFALDTSRTFVSEIVTLFERDVPLRVDELVAAQATGDRRAVARFAHSLKGMAANVGAKRLASLAQKVEAAASTTEPIEALIADVKAIAPLSVDGVRRTHMTIVSRSESARPISS